MFDYTTPSLLKKASPLPEPIRCSSRMLPFPRTIHRLYLHGIRSRQWGLVLGSQEDEGPLRSTCTIYIQCVVRSMWTACRTSKKHTGAACLQGYLYQLPMSPTNEFASDLVAVVWTIWKVCTVSGHGDIYEVVRQRRKETKVERNKGSNKELQMRGICCSGS
jgi:hypothetical protein